MRLLREGDAVSDERSDRGEEEKTDLVGDGAEVRRKGLGNGEARAVTGTGGGGAGGGATLAG